MEWIQLMMNEAINCENIQYIIYDIDTILAWDLTKAVN